MASPKLGEIDTTTLRNRAISRRKNAGESPPSYPPAAKKKGVSPSQFKKGFESYEGSPEDVASDKKMSKRMGMSMGAFEKTPEDRRKDVRGSIKQAIKQIKGR